jgi:hypothetical protein
LCCLYRLAGKARRGGSREIRFTVPTQRCASSRSSC